MPNIPAVCINPSCNTVFPSGFALEGCSATFIDNASGPCPKCGGMGKIPNGNYQALRDGIFATLFNIADIAKLTEIKQVLETAKKDPKLQEKLEKIEPKFKNQEAIIDWAKEHQVIINLILQFIAVLIAVLAYFKANPVPLNITQQTIINQSFYQFYNPFAPLPHVPDLANNKTFQKK